MAQPSQVSIPRATYHYFTNMQNLLLTAGTACFLGKHLVAYLGKDIADFPSLDKISSHTRDYFSFYDFASAASSVYSVYSVIRDGVAVVKDPGAHGNVRDERKGDFPRADNQYIGPKTWMAYRSASALFKTASSLLLVHEPLKRLGTFSESFSPTVRAVGGGLGALGFVIDIIDTQRAAVAHVQDVADGAVPTDAKITNPQGGDEDIHQEMIQKARRCDQFFMGMVVVIKLIGVVRALDMVESAGLIGRVSSFTVDHTENIYGGLFTAMSLTGIARHALYGATIQQLEQRNINKG
ncbi:MAG: hypothetical protein KFB93_02405 [Simkaniaceae bacterium]|nr:MAG: hypothetical protein KFB93_02405 [Simkaniaceae bacterium]